MMCCKWLSVLERGASKQRRIQNLRFAHFLCGAQNMSRRL
jgi:hypothetical protein